MKVGLTRDELREAQSAPMYGNAGERAGAWVRRLSESATPLLKVALPFVKSARTLRGVTMPAIAESKAITLVELRMLIRNDPPVGAEIAQACGYDTKKLAERCGCSVRRLEQVFHEFHRSPHRWLHEHKLLRDLQTLEQLDATGRLDSVKHFVVDRGYPHVSNFDRAFKKLFGASPNAFLAEREAALKRLGINLVECRQGRPYPIIEL